MGCSVPSNNDPLSLLSVRRPPACLYHYTSATGVYGIATEGAVWATVVHYLNDAQEFRFAIQLMEDALRRRNQRSACVEVSAFCSRLSEALPRIRDVRICVFSLTERGDLLSQWRAYCPLEGGYAIGFGSTALAAAAAKHHFVLAPCLYDEKDQIPLVEHVIDSVIRVFAGLSEDEKADDGVLEALLPGFFHWFAKIAPLLKHPTFEEEHEWRLVSGLIGNEPNAAYRPTKGLLIPYYRLPIVSEDGTTRFEEIVVGPNPHQHLARLSMESFVVSRPEFRVRRVRPSRTPFRRL